MVGRRNCGEVPSAVVKTVSVDVMHVPRVIETHPGDQAVHENAASTDGGPGVAVGRVPAHR